MWSSPWLAMSIHFRSVASATTNTAAGSAPQNLRASCLVERQVQFSLAINVRRW
jgi:hypothetical protein